MTWTKKDIRTLKSQIDTFWLLNRPLTLRASDLDAAAQAVRERLATRRVDVVLQGLRQFERLHSERYRQNCETIGNELARFGHTRIDSEFVQRFIKFAREEDASWKAATALRERVQKEGLPPEVIEYDPTADKLPPKRKNRQQEP